MSVLSDLMDVIRGVKNPKEPAPVEEMLRKCIEGKKLKNIDADFYNELVRAANNLPPDWCQNDLLFKSQVNAWLKRHYEERNYTVEALVDNIYKEGAYAYCPFIVKYDDCSYFEGEYAFEDGVFFMMDYPDNNELEKAIEAELAKNGIDKKGYPLR